MTKPEPEVLTVKTAARFERWLAKNHATTPQGVWLRLFRKDSGLASLTWTSAVDVALCYGWIDSQVRRYDGESHVQRFTPRRARSIWSKINTERVERLTKEGRMQPAGLAAVEAAKADGRWARAYAPPSTSEVPQDFLDALAKNKKAKAFYETLTKRNTYPISHRLDTAAKPETRARRIAAIIEMFERGEKFYD